MLRDLLDAVRRSGLDKRNADVVASATRHLATSTEGDGELEAALAQVLADAENLDAQSADVLQRYIDDVGQQDENDDDEVGQEDDGENDDEVGQEDDGENDDE